MFRIVYRRGTRDGTGLVQNARKMVDDAAMRRMKSGLDSTQNHSLGAGTPGGSFFLWLTESRPVLWRGNECQYHLSVHKVAAILVQLRQPECISSIVRISLHVAEVFHLHEARIQLLIIEELSVPGLEHQ